MGAPGHRRGAATPGASGLDAVSAEWVAGLTADGADLEDATARLHALLVRVARGEAGRRSGLNGIAGRELEDLAVQAASDALLSILRRVRDFRGDSRFTTWAYTFVVHEVSSKFARHAWRRDGVRFDAESWDRLPGRLGLDPEDVAESRELVSAVRTAVDDVLTAHQRRVFVAIILVGTPLDVVVDELGSNRNAVYKTMFDARRKLWAHLVTHGYIGTGEVGEGRHA